MSVATGAEPPWLRIARSYVGVREIPGAPTEPNIRRWLRALRAPWVDDETPWCGTFCAAVMRESGIAIPKHWYRALAWRDWGRPTHESLGAVGLFDRGVGKYHVGLLVGEAAWGRVQVLGGNQSDAVRISEFHRSRLRDIRWPTGYAQPLWPGLPRVATAAPISTREA